MLWELPLTYPTLCYKKIWLPPKGSSLWNIAPNSGLRKFSHGKLLMLLQNASTAELVDHTYEGGHVVVGYTSSLHDCNPLTPLL